MLHRLSSILLAIVVTAPAFASPSPSKAKRLKPAPLVVVIGGYASCVGDGEGGVSPFGSNFTSMGVQLVNELNEHFSDPAVNWQGMSDTGIHWLFSCFNRSSELFVQGETDERATGGGAWDLSLLTDKIAHLSRNFERPVFVISHSHGGWLAMRVMEALREPIRGGFLATIDPISFTECNASTYADALLMIGSSWPWETWEQIAGCRRAPADFTASDIQRVRANLGGHPWKHYWQNHFAPLHSGEIVGGPDSSLDMTPFFSLMWDGAASSWSAHTRISYLSSIWFGLKTSLMQYYNEAE